MTELGTLIYNDGKADGITLGISQGISQGIEKASIENARNLFLNGGSFDLVCNSIKELSRDVLQNIYDEVMVEKHG